MNTTYQNIVAEFTSIFSSNDDFRGLITEINGQIFIAEGNERQLIGKTRSYYCNFGRGLGMDYSAVTMLNQRKQTKPFKVLIEPEFNIVREDLGYVCGDFVPMDLLIIDRIEILPDFRGRGIGLYILNEMLYLQGKGAELAAINPTPLQFEKAPPDKEWFELMQYDGFSSDKKASGRKLSAYLSRLGFVKLPGSSLQLCNLTYQRNLESNQDDSLKIPPQEDFFRINIYDETSFLQTAVLTTIKKESTTEAFDSLIKDINDLSDSKSVLVLNTLSYDDAAQIADQAGAEYFLMTLKGALDDLAGKQLGDAIRQTLLSEISANLTAEVIQDMAISGLPNARADWNFLAMIAHARLLKRLSDGNFYNDFAAYRDILQDFYKAFGKIKSFNKDKLAKFWAARISAESPANFELIVMMLLSEIIVSFHELKGTPEDFGLEDLDDALLKIFDYKGDPNLN